MSFLKVNLLLALVTFSWLLSAQTSVLLASSPSDPRSLAVSTDETTSVDVFTAATYPGGHSALLEQIIRKVKYPQLAREYAIEGTVVVRLSLDRSGRVKEQKIVRSLGFGCDEEALAAVANLKRFRPARRGGDRSSSKVYIPIKFRLQ